MNTLQQAEEIQDNQGKDGEMSIHDDGLSLDALYAVDDDDDEKEKE